MWGLGWWWTQYCPLCLMLTFMILVQDVLEKGLREDFLILHGVRGGGREEEGVMQDLEWLVHSHFQRRYHQHLGAQISKVFRYPHVHRSILHRSILHISTLHCTALYCIHIRTRRGIHGQIYPFAWRSCGRRSPRELLKAKGHIWPYIPSGVLIRTVYHFKNH